MKNNRIKLAITLIFVLSAAAQAKTKFIKQLKESLKKPPAVGFYLQRPTGMITHLALDAHQIGMGQGLSYDNSYGFGMIFEFPISEKTHLFFDGTYIHLNVDLVEKDKKGHSDWVWEQTNYTTKYTQKFDTDVVWHQNVIGLRAGIKYFLYKSLWAGGTGGLYRWQINYGNSDQSVSYGHDEGMQFGMTLMSGYDREFGKDAVASVFIDLGFQNMICRGEIKDLFNKGWTWKDTTGAYLGGIYRLGIAVTFKLR